MSTSTTSGAYPSGLGFQSIGASPLTTQSNLQQSLLPDFSENDLLNVLGQHSLEKNMNS